MRFRVRKKVIRFIADSKLNRGKYTDMYLVCTNGVSSLFRVFFSLFLPDKKNEFFQRRKTRLHVPMSCLLKLL